MPAQTPLNPKQLAKRRFFNSNQPGPQFESVDSQDVSGEDAPRKRDIKADEKMENQFNETMRWGIHSQRLKSVQEVESSQQAMNVSQPQKSITQSSVPTFAAKEKGQGSYYTMGGPNINLQSMSQTSNANDMKDIGSIEGGNEHFKAQILDKRSNIGSKEMLEHLNDNQKIATLQWKKESSELHPYQKDADQFKVPSQKANEASNLFPLKDLNVIQNYERGNESMESQPKEKDSLPVFNHNQNPLANRSTPLSQFGYMQATATTVKKDTAVGNSFFGQAQIPIPFSCQKLPERNEIAFFQTLVPNSESKQTPQIFNKGSSLNLNTNFEKSQNSAYPLQNLDQQSKNNFQQSMQIDCSVMSNMQLTPMQSQNASQTNKSFHLQRVQVPVLASPLVSGTSIAQAQHNFRNPQVMNNHSQSENKSGEYAAGPQKISSSLTDNTPSSIRWDKSQFSVSPISHNLSNPSMFFSQNQFTNTQKTPQQLQQQIQMIHQQFQQKQQSQQPAVNSQSVQSPLSNQQVSKISRPSDHHLKQTGVQTNMTVNNQFDSILVQVDAQQLIYAQQHPPIAGIQQTLTNPRNIGNGDQSCQNLSRTAVVDENNGSNQVAEAQTMGKSILQNNSSQNLFQVGPQKMQAMLRPNPHQITTPDEIIQTDKPGNSLKRGATEEQEIMSSAQVNNNKFDSGGRQQVQQSPILSNQERLTTSQFKKDSSSQPSSMKNPQIELMKRKMRYQQKLQKIEYQLQVISQSQNQLSMQQAMLKQQHQSNMSQGNFFFAQPIVPSEILINRQQSPNINVGMMQQISPWINPWQQTRQQMMQMQMEKNMLEMNNQYGFIPQPIMFDQQSGFYCQSSPAIKNQLNSFAGMNSFIPSSSSGLSSSVDTNLVQQQQFFSEQQFMQQQMADQQQIYGNAMMLGGTPNRYTRQTFDNNQPFGSVQRPSSLSNQTPGRQGYAVFTQQISDPNSTAVFQQNPQSNNQTVASFQQMNNIQQNDQNASLDILMQNTRTPVSCKTPPLMKLSNEPNSTLNSQYHPSQLTQLGPQ